MAVQQEWLTRARCGGIHLDERERGNTRSSLTELFVVDVFLKGLCVNNNAFLGSEPPPRCVSQTLTPPSLAPHLLLGFDGRDGREQVVDADVSHHQPLPASRSVVIKVKRDGASSCGAHPDSKAGPTPSSMNRSDELASCRGPQVQLACQCCHSAEGGHCCRWCRCGDSN